MKKVLCLAMVLALLASLPFAAFAAAAQVKFTAGSSFQVGGTAKVDIAETCKSVMIDGSMTSDMYNAALERNVSVVWLCSSSSSLDKTGTTANWSAADGGQEFVCRVGFYADSAKTQYVGHIDSQPFTVTGGSNPKLEIYTIDLPDAIVGEAYRVQIKTSETEPPKFSEDRYSQLEDFGLKLSRDGVISGTPTKEGNCHVNIIAEGQSGTATANYDITITKDYEPHLELLEDPEKMSYVVGEVFDPTGMEVMIHTFDGSTMLSKDGQYLEYYKQPLKNTGDVKIVLKHADLSYVLLITVKAAPPEITTKKLPDATVGQPYSFKLESTDPDAYFGEYYNPGKANDLQKTGLILTQHGDLEGTPTEAGHYTFTIYADGEGGEGYATYTLVVKEANVPKFDQIDLPDGYMGKEYTAQISTSDPDAIFTNGKNTQLGEFGLNLHQNGQIIGTPSKAGTCYVEVVATGIDGESTTSFEIVIHEADEESTEPTATEKDTPEDNADSGIDSTGVLILCVVLGVLIGAMAVIIVLLVITKKRPA